MSNQKPQAASTSLTDNAPHPVKAIPPTRDRMQSGLLMGALAMALGLKAAAVILRIHSDGQMPAWFWISCSASLLFACAVWALRAATGPAALAGGLVCINVLLRQYLGNPWLATAMPALLALFLLTYAATRFGRSRKEALGLAEPRKGRRAAQVLANLGVAGLFAAGGLPGSRVSAAMLAAAIASLAEATADTVSSEAGQTLAGTAWGRTTLLITSGRPVPAGTDGGISAGGTAAGMLGAAIVVAFSPFTHQPIVAVCVFAAACFGLIFDSLLGATVERRGWFGNDLVNLSSTAFSALIALAAVFLL